jgi:hypothetical protein
MMQNPTIKRAKSDPHNFHRARRIAINIAKLPELVKAARADRLHPEMRSDRLGNDRTASGTVDWWSITPHRHHTVTLQPSNVAEGRLAHQETYISVQQLHAHGGEHE